MLYWRNNPLIYKIYFILSSILMGNNYGDGQNYYNILRKHSKYKNEGFK